MQKTLLIIVLAALCLNFKAKSQGTIINGKVLSTLNNTPLVGATIKVKGTSLITYSGTNGQFILKDIASKATLVISFIGYEPKEITAADDAMIYLDRSTSKLDEVQVIAYGTTSQRLNTGNVTSVKAADIESQPVSNALAALQGRVPGMVVTQTSGVAGSSFKVQIRGQSALDLNLSQNNPLFIIDGVPFEPGISATNQINSAANNPTAISSGGLSPLNAINPQDIESIDVLKDADATAIYGSRGANGVILITTKKGKPGATRFNINMYSGLSRVGNTMSMLNTQQYVAMRKEAFANDGLTPSANSSDPGYAPDIMLWDTTRYTDFKKMLIGNTAHSNNIQASVSGGNELTQFLIGGGYHKETTVYPGDFSDDIASFHFNINHSTANKKFTILFSGMYSSDANNMPQTDLTRYINLPPNLRLYDAQGNLSWADNGVVYNTLGNGDIINPLSLINQNYSSTNVNLSGNLVLSYKVLPGLILKSSFGYNTFNSDERSTQPSSSIDPNLVADGVLPSAAFAGSSSRNWIIEPQAEYNLATHLGKLDILIGNTLQNKSGKTSSMYGTNYSSDLLLNSIGAAGNITASNDNVQYRYTAVFGRINYNYQDKYIINISARRDGSSRFGPDKQRANFGAAGLAWIFSNEAFIQKNLSFLSYGKLRSSYGTTGNDQIGDYKFLNLWSSTTNTYNGLSGLYPKSLYNPNYNWEINKKFEVALDLGFFKDRILFSASYYNNRCSNQLINYTLPSQTGFFQVVKNFPGLVQNTGVELVLTTRNIHTNAFNWTSSFNISIPQNKLVSFPGLSTSSYKNTYTIGQSLTRIMALKYTGVDPKTGIYTFEDVNKDGLLTTADYRLSGNTDPKFYGGLQNNITFKNFDLSFFFQFTRQTGLNYISQLYSYVPGFTYNQPGIVLNRWQKPGDMAETEKFTSGYNATYGALGNLNLSDGKYTDASFIKLKNTSLSYRLPVAWLKRYHITGCRIYIEGQNLLTITNYKGADPESQNFYILPPLKTLVAGFQLNF